jgi:hypothetical protein
MERGNASFEGVVDELIAARIVYWMGGPYFALNLRRVSRGCARLVGVPPKISDALKVIETALMIGDSAACLKVLARDDDDRAELMNCAVKLAVAYDEREILAFVFDKTRGESLFYEHNAMGSAALAGNLNLCEFIRDCIIRSDEWKGEAADAKRVFPFSRMMVGAARANRRDLFELGLKWSEEYAHSLPYFDESMQWAAYSGNLGICKRARELAIEHGQTVYVERVLQHAAWGGSVEGCKLAREWGACQFDMMLYSAAGSGSIEMCKLARGWLDATARPYSSQIFVSMMMNAIVNSKLETMRLAHEWWVAKEGRELDLDRIRYNIVMMSAEHIRMEPCKFLYSIMQQYESHNPGAETRARIIEIIDEVMKYAVLRGDTEMCEMLHSWGAVHYEMYLAFADVDDFGTKSRDAKRRTAETRELVRGWMAARDIAQR